MTKKNLLAGLVLLVAGSLLIAACTGQQATNTAPTIDANAIYTQAAQTVQAGLSQTEVVPTTAPTETPAPTNTMDPNVAAAMTATAQSVQPGGPTPTGKAQTTPLATATKSSALPTATSKVVVNPPKTTGDKAELIGQSPSDGSQIQKSASFDVHLTLKNTGTTTWTKFYILAFYAGDPMGSPKNINMTKEVKPGDSIELVFTMKASDTAGKKKTIWVVQNADGVNFYSLWLDTEVTN